jgi:hypothetical protein
VAADERPKQKARLERVSASFTYSTSEPCSENSTAIGLKENAFESAPKSPVASAPKSSLEETASEPIAIIGLYSFPPALTNSFGVDRMGVVLYAAPE